MYCRGCGSQLNSGSKICGSCGTLVGEGIAYCDHCGRKTNEVMENCPYCGAALKNIIPQNVRKERIKELAKAISHSNRMKKVFQIVKWVSLAAIVLGILLFIINPEPKNPAQITITKSGYNYYGPYYSVTAEQYAFWERNWTILGFIVISIIILISSVCLKRHYTKLYKYYIERLREEKRCFAERAGTK